MLRPCDICGDSYEAKRPTSKYCSARCRQAKSRGATPLKDVTKSETRGITDSDIAPIATLVPDGDDGPGPLESALRAELAAVERDGTTLGLAALALARRVDAGRDTGAGMASLVRQLEATARSAVADVRSEASPLDKARDQLAERRAKRGA
jgi:hypothetical protein